MDTSILMRAGLTDSQAKGYLALIQHGALTATELATYTDETRTNAYAIADKLVELNLALKSDQGKTTYEPASPTQLKQLLINKQRELKAADSEISSIIPSLMATYRLTTDRPGVLQLEGADAIKQVYDDIIKTGETIHVFPSALDRDQPEVAALIDQQIKRQRAAGIKTKSLIRASAYADFENKKDELFEARPADFDKLDTQIIVYGDNVAMTTFGEGAVTTVLTSPQAAQTFNQIFAALWNPHRSSES